MNAPVDHLARRRTRHHPERPGPALTVHSYSEYTRHLDAGATALIIDSGPDRWLDLGHIPDNVDVTITGHTCAAVTGGDAHVRASAGVHITGERQSTNLTIDTRPISRLADHLNR